MIPAATIIGLFLNPHDPRTETQASDMRTAARALGLQVHLENASTEGEIDLAFAKSAQQRSGALIVGPSEFFTQRSEQIVALAARYALPAIYQYRLYAVAGGLATYGTSQWRRILGYIFVRSRTLLLRSA
jgi:putative tryptophan/tyrosine transport system substrate-binding protein